MQSQDVSLFFTTANLIFSESESDEPFIETPCSDSGKGSEVTVGDSWCYGLHGRSAASAEIKYRHIDQL